VDPTETTSFSAADPALGYLYQVRLALLWALRHFKDNAEFSVALETLDDVSFETKGTAAELLQTKHHRNRPTNLTDASPDLWKTLRVWFEGHASGNIAPGTVLNLITTAKAGKHSAAGYLRRSYRDVDAALKALEATTRSSQNESNAAGYSAFLKESPTIRRNVIESIVVFDGAPDIADLDEELRTEVMWAVERKHHGAFLERLEGWWFRRVLKQLLHTATGERILAEELEAQMSDLREQFKLDALPIDEDLQLFSLDDATREGHADSPFVRQIELIGAEKVRISAAVRDYYRAFEQRSRWMRNELVFVGEIEKFERTLVEEWELVFARMKDELGADVSEEVKARAARNVLCWAETVLIPIRPAVTTPFVTRGSLHMLSNEIRIGWHPEFRERLAHLLGTSTQGGPS
jgi:hypothetical protein